jgi:hypothetical protein
MTLVGFSLFCSGAIRRSLPVGGRLRSLTVGVMVIMLDHHGRCRRRRLLTTRNSQSGHGRKQKPCNRPQRTNGTIHGSP